MSTINIAGSFKKLLKTNNLLSFSCVVSTAVLLLVSGLASVAFAQNSPSSAASVWITDEFEVTMRSGKGNRQAIVRMLASGTQLELLESDAEEGYSFVRTGSGAEGWVLSRYVLRRPPARVTQPDIQARLASSEEQRKTLGRELRELSAENTTLKKQLGQSEVSGDGLEQELARISSLSSKTVQIDSENRQLQQSLAESQKFLEEARVESRRLASRSNREWFVIGALVVMFGIVVGLILPRIRWRKKSSWGEL